VSVPSVAPLGILVAASLWLALFPEATRFPRIVPLFAALAAIFSSLLLFRAERSGGTGAFDFDSLAAFSSLLLLGAIAVSLASRAAESIPLSRLTAGGALAVTAVSTRDLLLAAAAIQLYALLFREERKGSFLVSAGIGSSSLAGVALIAWGAGGTDLAAVSSAGVRGAVRLGLVLFIVSIAAAWLAQGRRAMRFAGSDVLARMASSFVLLVAVTTLFLRLDAWLPDAGLGSTYQAIALSALALGALGMVGATRISTFATALLIGRAGASLFAFLGGVHGRVPVLLELAASGLSLLLVALGLELAAGEDGDPPFSLDDLRERVSFPADVLLLTGALTAAAIPPFPGFLPRLASSSAALLSDYPASVAVMLGLTFLAGVGSMRIAVRLRESAGPPRRQGSAAIVGLVLAAAALWLLLLAPSSLAGWAARAASGIF
jgi:hypothetical protein